MVDGNHSVPLSPPSSPRMSAFTAIHAESEWQSQRTKVERGTSGPPDESMGMLHPEVSRLPLDPQKRPMLRTHKSFPYPLRQANASSPQLSTPSGRPIVSPVPQRERITVSNLEEIEPTGLPNITFGGSAPASPVSRLTPHSPSGERLEGDENHDDGEIVGSNDEGDDQKPMTAAELRAQKRKMKRFRLTHNQTRFLMSEFARQAHPDAAHRERLAREIPGLTARQVQVWFQNRRAKLKRLTSDDRERMMRSRALPDNFDMTQALHSPFGSTQGVGTPLASPASFQPSFPEANMVRPLSLDTLRRMPEGAQMSPGGMPPNFGGFSFTPPQSATETSSPASASGEPSPFSFSSQSLSQSPQRVNPFASSMPSTSGFTSNPQIPRLQLHDRLARTRAESLCSPLRTSMSYSNDGTLSQSTPSSAQSVENSAMGEQQLHRNSISGSGLPYGLGYSYPQIPGFQSGTATRMRSFSTSAPRRIELSQHSAHYNAPPRSATNPQSATFPNYQSSPLATPGAYNPSMMSAPHHVSSFGNSYLRHDSGQPEQYSPIGAVLGEVPSPTSQNDNNGGNDAQMQQY